MQMRRLLDAYPAIYLACHRRHVRDDESGRVVTQRQASVLDHLDARRPTTVSKLAEHLGIGRSAMSIAVTRLVRGGYIQRRSVAGDARSVGLTLTAAGARIKDQNSVLDPDLVREMCGLMPPAELERGMQGLELLAKYARIMLRRRMRGRSR
jgi:DNA-binding MarR family transcriptional regulator